MPLEYDDLSPIARAYLAVIAAGLPSARLAGDESFRIDYLTAICAALTDGRPPSAHLDGDGPQPLASFVEELRGVIAGLDDEAIIIAGAGESTMTMMPLVGQGRNTLTPAQIAKLDLNQPPKILDTYLAYRALDALLAHPGVYAFLMEKYGAASEIWQKLAAQGYNR